MFVFDQPVATSCVPSAQVFQEVTPPIQYPPDQCSVEQVLGLTVMKHDINEDGPNHLMDEGWQRWNTMDHHYCFPGNAWSISVLLLNYVLVHST